MYVVEFGRWDFREWAEKPEEKIKEFWKYVEQLLRCQVKDAELNGGRGIVDLVDWDGFSLSHHASPKGKSHRFSASLNSSSYFATLLIKFWP